MAFPLSDLLLRDHGTAAAFIIAANTLVFSGEEPPPKPKPKPAPPPPKLGVGRNEPCPCGSGKKFKRCHIRGSL